MGLKDPSHDPTIFSDSAFKHSVRNFFGVKPLNNMTHHNLTAQQKLSDTASYYDGNEFMAPYNPTANDFKFFKERIAQVDTAKDNEAKGEKQRGERVVEWDRARRDLGLFDED